MSLERETRTLLGPIDLEPDHSTAVLELVETKDFGAKPLRHLELMVDSHSLVMRLELFEDGTERLIELLTHGLEALREEEIQF